MTFKNTTFRPCFDSVIHIGLFIFSYPIAIDEKWGSTNNMNTMGIGMAESPRLMTGGFQ